MDTKGVMFVHTSYLLLISYILYMVILALSREALASGDITMGVAWRVSGNQK